MIKPTLATLEGEEDYLSVVELMGIEPVDFEKVENFNTLDNYDKVYLYEKYPDLMGVWPIIAAAGKAVVAGGIALGKKVINKAGKGKTTQATGEAKSKLLAALIKNNPELKKKLQQAGAKLPAAVTAATGSTGAALQYGLPIAALVAALFIFKRGRI